MPELIELLKPFLKPDAVVEDVVKVLPGPDPLTELIDPEKDRARAVALVESHPVLKSLRDSLIGQAVETYKTKNYQNDVNAGIEAKLKEQDPEETPAEKEARELRERVVALEKSEAEKDRVIARQKTIKDMAAELDKAGVKSGAFGAILENLVHDDQAQSLAMAKVLIDAVTGIVQETKDSILKKTGTKFLPGGDEPQSAEDIQRQYEEALRSGNMTEALRLAALKPKG